MGKKIFKVVGITAGILFLLFLILVVVVFYNLPSARDINKFFKKSPQHIVESQAQSESTIHQIPQQTSPVAQPDGVTTTDKEQTHNMNGKQLKSFLDESTPVSEFCHKLNKAKSGPIRIFEDSHKNLEELKSEEYSDLRLDALQPLAKTILQKPAMQKLVTTILELEHLDKNQIQDLEEEGIFSKAYFYAQAFQAFNELKSNLNEYEDVVDRSYLFLKLNDLIALKPDLQNDQRVQKFCEDTEYLFNSHKPVEFENEKKNFERLIGELGVEPQQIKYNPDYKTTLNVNYSKNSLQMSGGWLTDLVPQPTESTKAE